MTEFNVDKDGIAIHGFDCVSFFEKDERPVKGLPTHESKVAGAIFRFESADNKKLFDANPKKYLPQFGGFCAFACAMGNKADVKPASAYAVIDGKLYLNNNAIIHKVWRPKSMIPKAERKWAVMNGREPPSPGSSSDNNNDDNDAPAPALSASSSSSSGKLRRSSKKSKSDSEHKSPRRDSDEHHKHKHKSPRHESDEHHKHKHKSPRRESNSNSSGDGTGNKLKKSSRGSSGKLKKSGKSSNDKPDDSQVNKSDSKSSLKRSKKGEKK